MILHKNTFNAIVVTLLCLLPAKAAFALVAGGCGTACLGMGQGGDIPLLDSFQYLTPYLWRQLLLVIVFYLSGYICGVFVQKKKISVSLSRKMICILTFAVSYANSLSLPGYGDVFTAMLVAFGCVIILILMGSLSAPVRNRIPALKIVFGAINRPEDEPYTLAWLSTEAVATSLIIILSIPVIGYFSEAHMADNRVIYAMMLIPVFASGIGDALAEIVGKKWGRHHYTTRSLYGNRVYTRSLEGSAMVFLTAVVVGLAVAFPFGFQMPVFFWKAFILLPVTLTLAEALAPHTWDNPLLYLVGYLTIIVCLL